uniref:Uncharacterized protein n=1 Tax=Panagrolaimus sp. ES5 TaxID=591445 RepID=A0AC34FHY1_9BILA
MKLSLFMGVLFCVAVFTVNTQFPMQPSNIIVQIPGYGSVDLGQVPGPALVHALQGGQIAGLPDGSLEFAVREYLNGMYAAATRALQNSPLPQDRHYLPPLTMFAREDKELLLKLTVQTSLTHFSFSEHSASLIHGIGGGATNAEVKTKNIIPKKIVLFIIDVILCISC